MKLIKKGDLQNNSKQKTKSVGVLQILQNIRDKRVAGTVSYIFETTRINNLGEEYVKTAIKSSPISIEIFYKEENKRKVKRNLTEVLNIFKDLCHDYRASYFVIK